MSTLRNQNYRRRSQSASPSSLGPHAREKSWRDVTKRASPRSLAKDASSSQKWAVDIGGRGKRRRQDTPQIPPFVFGDRCKATAPFSSFFATKASDFELISRRDRDIKPRCHSDRFVDTRSMDLDIGDERDLSHLRSNAFWELHRSVTESGEGFVLRMRDYEHSRLRTDAYHKAKEAHKRGRKRSSIVASSRKPKLNTSSDNDQEEEDDDVQIFAGEVPRISLPGSPGVQILSMCLDIKNMGGREYQCPASTTRRFSSPFTAHESSSSEHPSDDEQRQCSYSTDSPITHSELLHTVSSSCHRLSDHQERLLEPLENPLFMSSAPCSPKTTTSHTEKAIAALSLAMANGAGGIADYETLLSVQAWPSMDDCQVGEMWH